MNEQQQRLRSRRQNRRPKMIEIATVDLSQMTTKEEMHRTMQQNGFILKSIDLRQQEQNRLQQIQQQKKYALFFRQEYVRLQFYHAYYFRQDVIQDTIYYNNMTWAATNVDYIQTNYDHIFKMEVITKSQIRDYATRYLIQCGRL